ncbi:MAG: signal peptidase II [Acidimicrobiales bacterium]
MAAGEVPAADAVPAPSRHHAAFAAAAAVVVGLDQATKHWALQALQDEPIDLVGSLRLNLTFNDSAAFSLGGGRTTLVALLALAVSGVVVVMGLRADRRMAAIGLGVILGGALGNLADRAFRAGEGVLGGHVVDFVDLQWWPVFNVADASLWVGIGLLLLSSWREPAEG